MLFVHIRSLRILSILIKYFSQRTFLSPGFSFFLKRRKFYQVDTIFLMKTKLFIRLAVSHVIFCKTFTLVEVEPDREFACIFFFFLRAADFARLSGIFFFFFFLFFSSNNLLLEDAPFLLDDITWRSLSLEDSPSWLNLDIFSPGNFQFRCNHFLHYHFLHRITTSA